jgi:hypothetical protein
VQPAKCLAHSFVFIVLINESGLRVALARLYTYSEGPFGRSGNPGSKCDSLQYLDNLNIVYIRESRLSSLSLLCRIQDYGNYNINIIINT